MKAHGDKEIERDERKREISLVVLRITKVAQQLLQQDKFKIFKECFPGF
jgi:hypothetical protein